MFLFATAEVAIGWEGLGWELPWGALAKKLRARQGNVSAGVATPRGVDRWRRFMLSAVVLWKLVRNHEGLLIIWDNSQVPRRVMVDNYYNNLL